VRLTLAREGAYLAARPLPYELSMTSPYSRIAELASHTGHSVRVRGWVTHVRSSGKVAFIVMRDGSGLLQAVLVKSGVSPETW
jgi:asparaginyl-tRNA synthetase